MRIRAIRVAECGRFVEPVALEGLSGGLDLLIGPNEAGKSTLLKALRHALLTGHRTTRADVAELRPYGGGAPLIEVDLDVAGERWRVRKRFLAERMAEVRSLSGDTIARGADAEALLERLLETGASGGRFPLLWLCQGALLASPAPDEHGGEVLRVAIAREIESAASGEAARQVKARVRTALEGMVTSRQGRRKGGFLEATQKAEASARALGSAREALGEVEAVLDRLAALGEASARLSAPAEQAARAKALADAETSLKTARDDTAARDAARIAAAEARVADTHAAAAAQELANGLRELDSLMAREADAAALAADLGRALSSAELALLAATADRDMHRSALQAAEVLYRGTLATARRDGLVERLGRACAASERMGVLDAKLKSLPRAEPLVGEARRLAARLEQSAARLEAAAVAVTIDYEEPALSRIVSDGRPIPNGERIVADRPLMLEIPGVGRIGIVPGTSSDREQVQASAEADRSALQSLLDGAGAADVAELEIRAEIARDVAAQLAEARVALAAIAPEGLAHLETETLAAIEATQRIAPSPDADDDATSLAARVEACRVAFEAADATSQRAGAECEAARRRVAAEATRAEERMRRRSEIEKRLPPPEQRAAKRAEIEGAADATRRALDEALRIEAAWSVRAPDADGLARLEAGVHDARRRIEHATREEAARAAEMARLEGALEAARREDIVARVATLEAESERAEETLGDIAEEVAALQLLDAELSAEESRLRERFLAPVHSRLQPYLHMVFPEAVLALGDNYAAEELIRDQRREGLKQLSDGTREQIAVLTRLAFARLLADQGMAVPLVLDDVLVYSDDHRIVAMHRALEAAAETHQVIVLSCREQSFAGLRGTRVAIAPWRAEARAGTAAM